MLEQREGPTLPSPAPPATRTIERTAALRRIRMARGDRHLLAVVAAFAQADIEHIVLKGAVTRSRYYAPDEVRVSADVDLLVRPSSWSQAGAVLRRLGYTVAESVGHSDTWVHDEWTTVDLHRTLPYASRSAKRVWAALAPHLTRETVGSSEVTALDRPAHLVHLAIHFAQNRFDAEVRAGEDFRRAVAVATPAELAEAHAIAESLGVAVVVRASLAALAGDAVDERDLPVRKLGPGRTLTFLASPVAADQRLREARRALRSFWSPTANDRWLASRGRDEPGGRAGRLMVAGERVCRAVAREARNVSRRS